MKILNKTYERYFKYLCSQAKLGKRNGHEKLALKLFETDFIYTILDDENRSMDGIAVREEFIFTQDDSEIIEKIFLHDDYQCSIFELLLGIAKRIDEYVYNSETGSKLDLCFKMLIDNLELSQFNDEFFDEIMVDDILYNLNNRLYKSNGKGSIFPLKNPERDSRDTPIWLQMTAFMSEHDYKLPRGLGFL